MVSLITIYCFNAVIISLIFLASAYMDALPEQKRPISPICKASYRHYSDLSLSE